MPSSVYTASIGVRTEYSVVKMQSRCFDSANWPMKAKFTAPSGTTSGRSPAWRGIKNAVMYGIITGTVFAPVAASSSISSTGTPRWYSHSRVISSPVQSSIGLFT